MRENDYSRIRPVKYLPANLLKLIYENSDREDWDILKGRGCQVTRVTTPFILADNFFDLNEANNTTITINVKQVSVANFTGGSCYYVYEVDDTTQEAYVVNGNDEEGYNIFQLN